MPRFFALILALALVGCASQPAKDQDNARNTPLNEEVDEVAKIRDQVTD